MDVLLLLTMGSRSRIFYSDVFSMPPIGLGYLSACLKKELGLTVGLVDFQRDHFSTPEFYAILIGASSKSCGDICLYRIL